MSILGKHFPCVCDGCRSQFFAAQHAGDFIDSLRLIQSFKGSPGSPLGNRLHHFEVMIAKFCNLRQMGDADHLVMARQMQELLAHHFGYPPADARIDFIKNDAFHCIGCGQDRF